MNSILRTITTTLIPRTISVSKFMDSSPHATIGGSQRLLALAQHLRLYKPPPFPEDIFEQSIEEESGGKVVSQLGFPESATKIQHPEKFKPKKAAVLICLFEGDHGDLRVILTKRSSKLSSHSGEVSLPGGKADEGDKDDADTAKREANEEIGLDPELVNVVTVLEPFLSKHLLRVVPVIGILHDKKAFRPVLNPAEVESVFDAPLEMFLKDENRSQEEREWMGEKAASVVYQRPPAFIEQNPKFKLPQVVSKDSSMT
ncbi:unnamed protein product [Vicia faba]|uniref:Nudix hydrolase domain-containing protein n=1 Tax=Vicia faba TaxID=3906 RepID=A0AAV1B7P8_VICFA|nr:unnamed protein product [Vicia faba]